MAQHATAWYLALTFLAFLSIIVIHFSLMKSYGVLRYRSKKIVHLRDSITSAKCCASADCPLGNRASAPSSPEASSLF